MIEEHVESINLKDIIIVHGHDDRTNSTEFHHNVEKLKADGYGQCFVCGSTGNLQVHHFLAEWSEGDVIDFEKLKVLGETFDVYGYAAKRKDVPITSVDDIRNLMVLCQEHHTGTNSVEGNPTGIHNLVFPFWLAQCNCKKDEDPVPQEGENLAQAEDRINKK